MLLTSNVDLFFAIGISNEDDNDDVDGVVDSVDDSSFSVMIISLFVLKFWLFSSTTFDSSLVEQFVDFKLENFFWQIKEIKMNKIKLNQIITRSGLTQTQQHNVNIEQKKCKVTQVSVFALKWGNLIRIQIQIFLFRGSDLLLSHRYKLN